MKTITWTNKAIKQLSKLPPQVRAVIWERVGTLTGYPKAQGDMKKLVDRGDLHRLRVQNHRIIFALSGDEILIVEVLKRDEHTY